MGQKKFLLILVMFISIISILLSGELNADISVPSCEKLRNFPLTFDRGISSAKYNPVLQEYFGKPLLEWNEKDFDVFVSAFIQCHKNDNNFFPRYSRKYFPGAVKEASDALKRAREGEHLKGQANEDTSRLQKEVESLSEQAKSLTIAKSGLDRLREIKKEAEELWGKYQYSKGNFPMVMSTVDHVLNQYERAMQAKQLEDQLAHKQAAQAEKYNKKLAEDAVEAKELIRKHGNIGPPADFLVAQFQTHAGASTSGDMGTVIKLYDRLDGKKKWDKRDNVWILTQKNKDNVTGVKHEILYAFYDLRSKEGYIFLDRVVIDQQDYPAAQLFYLIAPVMEIE